MKTETTVGDDLESREGGWTFDESVAENFDRHVRKSIPHYLDIQTHVALFSDWFLSGRGSETVYDLGCATGTTIARLIDHHQFDSPPTFVGIDESEAMLEQAREKVPPYDHIRFSNQDISESPSFPDASLIISLFTLSFLSEGDRRRVIEAAYEGLQPGGALIFVEKTYPESGRFQAMFREQYFDFKRRSGHEADEVLGKASSLRGQLRPLTAAEYEAMLSDAGFADEEVEEFYRWNMWAGYVARKTL